MQHLCEGTPLTATMEFPLLALVVGVPGAEGNASPVRGFSRRQPLCTADAHMSATICLQSHTAALAYRHAAMGPPKKFAGTCGTNQPHNAGYLQYALDVMSRRVTKLEKAGKHAEAMAMQRRLEGVSDLDIRNRGPGTPT
jgi:hypothetical protein